MWEVSYRDFMISKAQAESNGQDGGFLAPEEWVNALYGVLRPAMVTSTLPITRRPVGFRVSHVPVVTGDVTVAYYAENGALTASQFQYSQRTATMRKQAVFVQVSNELLRDWLPAAENTIRNEAARAIARDRDKQILLGNGQSGQPVGLLNMTNVTTSALNAAPTYDNLVTGILNVENLNSSTNVPTGEAACTGIVGSVQLKRRLHRLYDSNNRPLIEFAASQIRNIPPAAAGQAGAGDLGTNEQAIESTYLNGLLGVPQWKFTNLIAPGSAAQIFYGDWQYLIYFERQDFEIMASNVAGTAFQNDTAALSLFSAN